MQITSPRETSLETHIMPHNQLRTLVLSSFTTRMYSRCCIYNVNKSWAFIRCLCQCYCTRFYRLLNWKTVRNEMGNKTHLKSHLNSRLGSRVKNYSSRNRVETHITSSPMVRAVRFKTRPLLLCKVLQRWIKPPLVLQIVLKNTEKINFRSQKFNTVFIYYKSIHFI